MSTVPQGWYACPNASCQEQMRCVWPNDCTVAAPRAAEVGEDDKKLAWAKAVIEQDAEPDVIGTAAKIVLATLSTSRPAIVEECAMVALEHVGPERPDWSAAVFAKDATLEYKLAYAYAKGQNDQAQNIYERILALAPREQSYEEAHPRKLDAPQEQSTAWIATSESGKVLHFSEADGWKVEAVQSAPLEQNEPHTKDYDPTEYIQRTAAALRAAPSLSVDEADLITYLIDFRKTANYELAEVIEERMKSLRAKVRELSKALMEGPSSHSPRTEG